MPAMVLPQSRTRASVCASVPSSGPGSPNSSTKARPARMALALPAMGRFPKEGFQKRHPLLRGKLNVGGSPPAYPDLVRVEIFRTLGRTAWLALGVVQEIGQQSGLVPVMPAFGLRHPGKL